MNTSCVHPNCKHNNTNTMGQSSRRRKGKSGSRSNTPTPSAEIESKVAEADEKKDDNDAMDVETTKEEPPIVVDEDALVVLTSEKRRGVYECDYCHSDISQQPRIRCAVCSDFDLCLDCFATSDHEAMIARIKASAQTQTELTKDGIGSTAVVVSSAAANHEADHKYRVCDSTRYPMFPTGRVVPPEDAEASAKKNSFETFLSDDPKTMWTAEEDLRLIDAIATHGLGNWVDISEAIGGQGSVGKTPKRCMERYLDDFLGRYGHILPQYTIIDDIVEESAETTKETKTKEGNTSGEDTKEDETKTEGEAPSEESSEKKEGDEPSTAAKAAPSTPTTKISVDEEEGVRTSKRRSAAIGSAQGGSLLGRGSSSRKKLRVVNTESFPGYENVWPNPYLPEFENAIPGKEAAFGKEVARDQSCKAELTFVKSSLSVSTKEEADKIRKTWVDTKLGKVGSPTVLPPRPQDAVHLLGSELAGFMPRRGDFDVEHENDAETALADMEFIRGDKPEDKELKLKVLQIYCEKLDEREKRKKFVLERHLYDYRKYVQNDMLLPMDERDLVHRMRLFERFHTPDEHKKFIEDILKAKRLRKEIAKLQMYRRMGIKSLAQAEMYELDKDRRQFHKKLEGDAKAKAAALASAAKATNKGSAASEVPTGPTRVPAQMKTTDSLWKQYRTSKNRRNSNRSTNSAEEATEKSTTETTTPKETEEKEGEKKDEKETQDVGAEGEKKSEDEEMKTEERKEEEKTEEKDTEQDEATPAIEMADAGKPDAEEKKDETTESEEKKEEETTETEKKPVKDFDMTRAPCRDLLSRKELALCERQQIYPVQYLEIKKVLIHEALINGLLDKETASSSKRTIVKIDVERRGNVVDFLVRAGWISRKLADVAMRVVTPQPS